MGTYQQKYEPTVGNGLKETVTLTEQSMCGSSRVGVINRKVQTAGMMVKMFIHSYTPCWGVNFPKKGCGCAVHFSAPPAANCFIRLVSFIF